MDAIQVVKVTKHFEGVMALNRVSLDVSQGVILGMIGPNGAGKTTLINIINGVYQADGGEVYFQGRGLGRYKVYEVAQLGIARTFQIARIFLRLSVFENVLVPSSYLPDRGKKVKTRVLQLLDFVGLLEKRDQYAYELSGGQQKLLEFARALMPDPHVILMDEPFAGVHPQVKVKLLDSIRKMNEAEGKTFIIVSHDIRSIASLCQWVVVLNAGEKLVEGTTEDVLNDPKVLEAYLGE